MLSHPSIIAEETKSTDLVVIDEIQKLPVILDVVHNLIVKRKQKFLLTGSSARKLRRGTANLLAGRAFTAELFPLVSPEIKNFDLMKYINSTGLPEFYADSMAKDFLFSYVGTYLQEEIQAESLTRNLTAFSRFLEICALANGEEISYANISSDCGVKAKTVEAYFNILEDTLIGFKVLAFKATKKHKAISRAKHYFFDVGVVNSLTRRGLIQKKSELFGKAFEHFIGLELRAYLSYTRSQDRLQYWRSTSKFEVGYIIGTEFAIEVKATSMVHEKHLKGLRALMEEGLIKNFYIVSTDPVKRVTKDNITIWPYQEFLTHLWKNTLT